MTAFEDRLTSSTPSSHARPCAPLSGEEAVAVGVCEALQPDDYMTSTPSRPRALCGQGRRPRPMFAELLGKEAGYCKGKGGSMHIADPDTGNSAQTRSLAAARHRNRRRIFGEASWQRTGGRMFLRRRRAGQGLLYEVMNMAALWKLPVIYVCENNLYNEYTHNGGNHCRRHPWRGPAFGVPSNRVDGQDVQAVYHAAKEMIDRARRGDGPGYLVADTYRYHGHHIGDINREYYRSKAEEAKWKRT